MLKKIFLYIILGISPLIHSSWALKDLEFVKNYIKENHPGIYNQEDPNFKENLEIFYQKSKAELEQTQSEISHKKILSTFAELFSDSHLSIQFPTFTFQHTTTLPFKQEILSADHINPLIYWIRIPTFESNKTTITALEDIVRKIKTIRTTPYIVFDLRGNTGGSSFWGEELIYALLGKNYIDYKRTTIEKREYVEWRASLDNIQYWENTVIPFINSNFPLDSKEAIWANKSLDGLKAAYAKKEPYYLEHTLPDPGTIQPAEPLCNPIIIVIIDKYCNSACLDFIDELKIMAPTLKLVGTETAADSIYMESRTILLPSKRGILNLPIKVARNRVRKHRETYKPDYPYTGDMHDTQGLKQYITYFISQWE